ncbi:MAG: hypothetical protein ACOZAO_05945 [Patescibacteria group bacterium]
MIKLGTKYWPSGDLYGRYETGMARLMLNEAVKTHFQELVRVFKVLQKNLDLTRLYGDVPARRDERSQLIVQLNLFCIQQGIGSFNNLCEGYLTPEEEDALVNIILHSQNPLQLNASN